MSANANPILPCEKYEVTEIRLTPAKNFTPSVEPDETRREIKAKDGNAGYSRQNETRCCMSRIIYVKAGEKFVLEAISFNYPSMAEKHVSSVRWEMQADEEAPVKIGTGKSVECKTNKKHVGKKITFRGYIERDSLSKYPMQRIVCYVERDMQNVRICNVKGGADRVSAGEIVEFEATRYDVDKKHVRESTRRAVKWDVKTDGEKFVLADQNQVPCRGEKIKFAIPASWAGKEATIMPYLSFSTETVSVKINVFPAEEYIIAVGGQSRGSDGRRSLAGHLVGPASKLMFVHQALRQMNLNRNVKFTFLVCSSDNGLNGAKTLEYTKGQLKEMRNAVENLHKGTFIKVNGAEQIINYINTGDINNSGNITPARKNKPIKQLSFYSHGFAGEISSGLDRAGFDRTEFSFEESEVKKLNPEAFDAEARIYVFARLAGPGNPETDKSMRVNEKKDGKYPNNGYDLLSAHGLAQKMADQTKATAYAYPKGAWYGDTLFTSDEYDLLDACDAYYNREKPERTQAKYSYVVKNGPDPEDDKKYGELKAIRINLKKIDGALFLPQGARHPVREADTPQGLPDDTKTYMH